MKVDEDVGVVFSFDIESDDSVVKLMLLNCLLRNKCYFRCEIICVVSSSYVFIIDMLNWIKLCCLIVFRGLKIL